MLKKAKLIGAIGLAIILIMSLAGFAAEPAGPVHLYSMDSEEEIAGYSNDNTGAQFALSQKFVRQGSGSVEVIPSGEAPETKLALDLTGPDVKNWAGQEELVLNVYLPKENELNPNMFFLGMADVTGEWKWVDGVFAAPDLQPGWNEIRYPLSGAMQAVEEGHSYKLYFAFAYVKKDNSKVPLTESFFIDGIWLEKGGKEQAEAEAEGQIVNGYLWTMDTPDEVAGFGNDNTGAEFALNGEKVFQGTRSVAVIPSGEAPETKLALDLVGDRLQHWGAREVVLNVYLPPGNEHNPNMFFLGMADVTAEWTWVGGIFSETKVQPGWNEVRFQLAENMASVDKSGKYKLYFAFAYTKQGGQKVPLTETFYIDGLRTVELQVTRADLLQQVPEEVKQEVARLLQLDDEQLLDAIEKRAFDYFWHEANSANGLIKDRSTEDSPASIAAVGFGLTAIPIGIERGWISREEGYERVLTTLRTFANGGVEGQNGFFYHFVDMETGRRYGDSEISSIDTALFIAGALFAGEYFAGTEVEELAQELYQAINWQWMMNDGDTLSMGWKPEGGFLTARWNSFNESLLMYILAIGSPTYPIPASAWDNIYRPVRDNYISLPQESLFVYQYSHAWIDFRDKEDKYANYWNNSVIATRVNRLFAVLKRYEYESYDMNIWGLSASDGPAGYKAYGAAEGQHDGTIAPYASIASLPFTPELSKAAIRAMLKQHGPLIWDRYGFVSAFNVDQNWYSDQYIGIDQGDIVLMIENYRSGLVWKYFMQNEAVKAGLAEVGFTNKDSDYAVTPWYQEKFAQMRLAPKDKTAYAVRVEEAPAIDGAITEWADLEGYEVTEDMNVPAGGLQKVDKRKQILHSTFYACWDEEYLYLAAAVADEYIVTNIEPDDLWGFYRTDSIEFYIDPARAGSSAGLMKLAILPFDTEGNAQAVRHEDANPGPIAAVNPGIKVASKRTDHGYNIEVAIPFEAFGVQPAEDITFGFSHTIHNSNDEDAALGAYVRENVLAWNNLPEVWSNPDLWGELILK